MKRTASLVFTLGLLTFQTLWAADGSTVDLSPASWPPGELEEYAELNFDWRRPHPRGKGRRGLVAGTFGALAVHAGLETLKQGGSAADAAAVTSMAQIVLQAGSTVSFAGKYLMTYYEASTGKVFYLNAGYHTLERETDPLTIPECGIPSGRTALVPGFMAGIEASHQRFGKLPWSSLFVPAVYFAEEGFRLPPTIGYWIDARADVLSRLPATREIFTSPDGDLYQSGEIFRQPQLARTLRHWARRGAEDAYRGVWSKRFRRAVRAEGSRMTYRDLRQYEAIWSEPILLRYRGYAVHLPGQPAMGGRFIKSILRRLKPQDMAALGHYTESSEALYHLIQAIREFWLSDEWQTGSHSDGVVVIDEDGNVAAVLHSINTVVWGTTGIFVDGVSIPDSACFQQREIQAIGPGARLPDWSNPLIVLSNGRPVLATSAIGRDLTAVTSQALVNMLDYGLNPKLTQIMPLVRRPDFSDPTLPAQVTEGDFSPSLLDAVRAMGVPIVEQPPGEGDGFGWWIGAVIEPGGRLVGADPSVWNGLAEGY
ncbi:MAG: hypothetical protein GY856_45310 [bacterium]|nr:hypothetical protein [bacterium]